MAKKRSSRKKGMAVGVFTAMLLLAGAMGFGYWITTKWTPVPELPKQAVAPPARPNSVVFHEHKKVKVFVVKMVKDEPVLVPDTRQVKDGDDPHASALESLIETNQEGGDSQYLIPSGTKLLGVHVKDGIAYADFSRELKDNLNPSSTNEALLVNSIVHTLTQFKDVEKVQILVEGKRIESLGGHLDISSPIARGSSMLGEGDSE